MGNKAAKKSQAQYDVNAESRDQVKELPVQDDVPEKFKRRGRRASVSAESDVDTMNRDFRPKVIPKSPEALARIRTAVAKSFLFSGLDEDQSRQIFDSMEERKVQVDDVIIKQGDPGDYFYIIDSGEYGVYKTENGEEKRVFEYKGSGSFGELALMYNCPRAATVKAESPGVLFVVDRMTFRHIIINGTAQQRKLYESFLEKVPLLKNLSSTERAMIADCLEPLHFQDGDIIIKQGDPGDRFFLVEKGEAIATQKAEGKGEAVVVGRMQAGQYFGERALVTNEPRAANVVAVGDLKAAAMDRATFERLLGDCKQIMQRQIQSYETAEQVLQRQSTGSLNEEKKADQADDRAYDSDG